MRIEGGGRETETILLFAERERERERETIPIIDLIYSINSKDLMTQVSVDLDATRHNG